VFSVLGGKSVGTARYGQTLEVHSTFLPRHWERAVANSGPPSGGKNQRRCNGRPQMTSAFRAGISTKAVGKIGRCCAAITTVIFYCLAHSRCCQSFCGPCKQAQHRHFLAALKYLQFSCGFGLQAYAKQFS